MLAVEYKNLIWFLVMRAEYFSDHFESLSANFYSIGSRRITLQS